MEDDGDHGAGRREVGLSDPEKEDNLGNKEARAKVGVDRGTVVLGAPERREDSDADNKAGQADGATNIGEDV